MEPKFSEQAKEEPALDKRWQSAVLTGEKVSKML